jgi:hypothetical protein
MSEWVQARKGRGLLLRQVTWLHIPSSNFLLTALLRIHRLPGWAQGLRPLAPCSLQGARQTLGHRAEHGGTCPRGVLEPPSALQSRATLQQWQG